MKAYGEVDAWLHAFLNLHTIWSRMVSFMLQPLKTPGLELGGIFLIIKPTRRTVSQIYFDKVLYMFQTVLLSITRSFNTVYAAVGICHASSVDCLLARSLADSKQN